MQVKKAYLVGLAGGSASGKTTMIKKLQDRFKPSQLCVISLDNYYKPLSQQSRDDRGYVNFDDPEGIDYRRVNRDIGSLLKGEQVKMVEYTFNNPGMFPSEIAYRPSPIILVEGIFVYYNKQLKKRFNWRLWIETPENLALERRIERDTRERGMTIDEIHYQWQHHVLPARKEHLDPHREDVHLLIHNHNDMEQGLELVSAQFEQILRNTRGPLDSGW